MEKQEGRGVPSQKIHITLRKLRESAGYSQTDFAKLLGVSQSELSRFERRRDHTLSAVRRYAEALGGRLDVVFMIGGQEAVLDE